MSSHGYPDESLLTPWSLTLGFPSIYSLAFVLCNVKQTHHTLFCFLTSSQFSLSLSLKKWNTKAKLQQHRHQQILFPLHTLTLHLKPPHFHLMQLNVLLVFLHHLLNHLHLQVFLHLLLLRHLRLFSALVLPARFFAADVWRNVFQLRTFLQLIHSNSPSLIECLELATSSSCCRFVSIIINMSLICSLHITFQHCFNQNFKASLLDYSPQKNKLDRNKNVGILKNLVQTNKSLCFWCHFNLMTSSSVWWIKKSRTCQLNYTVHQ